MLESLHNFTTECVKQGPRYRGSRGDMAPSKFSVVAAVNLYSFIILLFQNIR